MPQVLLDEVVLGNRALHQDAVDVALYSVEVLQVHAQKQGLVLQDVDSFRQASDGGLDLLVLLVDFLNLAELLGFLLSKR